MRFSNRLHESSGAGVLWLRGSRYLRDAVCSVPLYVPRQKVLVFKQTGGKQVFLLVLLYQCNNARVCCRSWSVRSPSKQAAACIIITTSTWWRHHLLREVISASHLTVLIEIPWDFLRMFYFQVFMIWWWITRLFQGRRSMQWSVCFCIQSSSPATCTESRAARWVSAFWEMSFYEVEREKS